MLVLALALALPLAARAAIPADCAALEREELADAILAPAAPWDAARSAFLGYLESLRDPAAKRAAAFLRDSRLRLAAADVSVAVGRGAGAEYDPVTRTIYFDAAEAQALRRGGGDVLRTFVRRESPLLVHELFHARLRAELGPLPPFAEEELLADAEETLFVLARLAAEPDAWGLSRLDARVGGAPGPLWWTKPLAVSGAELDWRLELAAGEERDPWLAERWRMVRGMGAGYEAFERVLREGGVLDGDSVFAMDEGSLRRAIGETRALRDAHARCLDSAPASERPDLTGWIERLDGEELAYEDAGRLRSIAKSYRRLMDSQRRELRKLEAR